MHKVVLIGAGTMGSALAEAWLKSKILSPEQLLIVETDATKLSPQLRDLTKSTLEGSISKCEFVIFAVKPQDSSAVFKQIQGFLRDSQVCISIMAGITFEVLSKKIGTQKVVRCMPNLPIKVGKSLTVYCADSSVEERAVQFIDKLFSVCGTTVSVKDEKLVDAATALSASGSGYVYYLLQQWIEVAGELGYTNSQAEILVKETVLGALELWSKGDKSPEELRKSVMSKGGTTQAALEEFERGNLGQVFKQGIRAALKRGVELSEKVRES